MTDGTPPQPATPEITAEAAMPSKTPIGRARSGHLSWQSYSGPADAAASTSCCPARVILPIFDFLCLTRRLMQRRTRRWANAHVWEAKFRFRPWVQSHETATR